MKPSTLWDKTHDLHINRLVFFSLLTLFFFKLNNSNIMCNRKDGDLKAFETCFKIGHWQSASGCTWAIVDQPSNYKRKTSYNKYFHSLTTYKIPRQQKSCFFLSVKGTALSVLVYFFPLWLDDWVKEKGNGAGERGRKKRERGWERDVWERERVCVREAEYELREPATFWPSL